MKLTRNSLLFAALAVAIPFVVNLSIVFVGWLDYHDSRSFISSAFLFLFWAPILGAAAGSGVLLAILRGWWRLLAVPYGLLMFYLQAAAADLFTMALLQSWL